MKALLVVDLQPEFARGFRGKRVYNDCLNYVKNHRADYDWVLACVYQNNKNPNMHRLLSWTDMKEIMPIEFSPNYVYMHSGYSIGEYPEFSREDHIDVIGFDTDACVLSACFDLFNIGADFSILGRLCYSSGGQDMHEAGLKVMKRQFGKALDLNYKS